MAYNPSREQAKLDKRLVLTGSVSAVAGIAICAVSGLARVAGYYYVFGFQSTTLFNVGVGLMVFTCLLRLEEIAARDRQ